MAWVCRICNVTSSGPVPHQAHLAGRSHRQKIARSTSSIAAQSASVSNPTNQQTHAQTSHQTGGQGAPRSQAPRPRGGAPRRGATRTAPSSRSAPGPHARSEPSQQPDRGNRRARARRARPRRSRPPREYSLDFGVIRDTESDPVTRSVDLPGSDIQEISIRPVKNSRSGSVAGFQIVGQNRLSSGRLRVSVKFSPRHVQPGVHIVRLCSEDGDGPSENIRAILGAPEDHEELKPIAPYREPELPMTDDWHRRKALRGKPTISTPDFKKLDFFDIPKDFRRRFYITDSRQESIADEIELQSLLPATFDVNTYKAHWTQLLWLEEMQMEVDLMFYDMERATVEHVSGLDYSLEVPGLSEKRPSVIVTDLVVMKEPGASYRDLIHGGYVTQVQQSNLILRMHESFPSMTNERWDIRFTVNRLLLRRMHDSIGRAAIHERILFPALAHIKPAITGNRPNIRLDRKIAANDQQSLAVQNIVTQPPGDVPFIIFGPPGTGKTTALVEAVHQVVTSNSKHRVLICAPSNTASDLIATRLSKMHNPSELLRLNAPARAYDSLPPDLRRYSAIEDNKFKSPPKHELIKFQMVVSTCYYASVPRALGIENHFTHIFVDEAGHATEPEVMVAVLQNAGPETNVVVCGDPMQLGPIVQSKVCSKLGMGTSFLERLMKMPIYNPESQNQNRKMVKLLQNYRNHPAILQFSNVAFYKNELQSHADPMISRSLERFNRLPREGFPIIFHSICGHNIQEARSPSYFNIDEATVVKKYVQDLLSDRRFRLKGQDIGVIAPYRQQCVKIRQLLQKQGHGSVDVKVTEDWQGQERRVIIVSTVRSDPELPETNALEFLGFVSSWRRTNVILTRAQALLIVIGHAPTLELDPAWYFFLHYVHASGGWTGDVAGYAPGIPDNIFQAGDRKLKNYENYGDTEWNALRQAAGSFYTDAD